MFKISFYKSSSLILISLLMGQVACSQETPETFIPKPNETIETAQAQETKIISGDETDLSVTGSRHLCIVFGVKRDWDIWARSLTRKFGLADTCQISPWDGKDFDPSPGEVKMEWSDFSYSFEVRPPETTIRTVVINQSNDAVAAWFGDNIASLLDPGLEIDLSEDLDPEKLVLKFGSKSETLDAFLELKNSENNSLTKIELTIK